MSKSDVLPTIWRVPDALWETLSKVLAVYDAPSRMGRPRMDQRLAFDGILYRLRTGCQWNALPRELGDDASVYRTFRRWEQKGIFDILWAVLLTQCEELDGVDWQWQSADGCLGKARGVPKQAGVYDPKQAGVYDPKQAGVDDPKQAGVDDPKQAGVYDPKQAGVDDKAPTAKKGRKTNVSAPTPQIAARQGSRRACLSKAAVARLLCASPEPTSTTTACSKTP